mmetsp:Transcript_11078/g.12484  ORF Transcript_11078/g.12484 Transcript_11078/m.12484 type:complete len:346 (+) Transcript_11078:29-1066(+)
MILYLVFIVLLFVKQVPVTSLTPPSVLKKAFFGLEGFIAKRKVNKNLDPSATKFLVDSDEFFVTSGGGDGGGNGDTTNSNNRNIDSDCVSFDHSLWDTALKEHAKYKGEIDGITTNLVDYAGMANDPYVKIYTEALATVDLETMLQKSAGSSDANNELLAFYINAYNCLCIGHVTKYYKASKGKLPISITAVTKTMTDYKKVDIWDVPAGVIGGVTVTLNDIEHKILRSLWDEPRIHASIVCASASCPNLRPEAFVGERINAQMDNQATSWVSDNTKGISVDRGSRQLTISRIFLWFSEDFQVRDTNGPIAWAKEYYQGKEQQQWSTNTNDVEYFPYNWKLNAKR